MKGSERDSEQILAMEIRARSNLADIHLKEPLKSIVGWIKELEGHLKLFNDKMLRFEKRTKQLERGIEAIDEKMKRI
ncbi:MAG: hypothetical protein E3J63_02250, partial [Elusimicrobia bacterium]